MFETLFSDELAAIEKHLHAVLKDKIPAPSPELLQFWECMNYSLLSGGKRFRPLLAALTAKALDRKIEHALPMATAVELIHTYSLIHDDLPVMDNDDMRRGRPTNHKVYGDAQALLAGDALLTAAFGVLAESESKNLRTALALLSEAAGPRGMVGGQVLDIATHDPNERLLAEIHKRKTGALIRVAVEGTAVLLGASEEQVKLLRTYGENLGMAFQIADDIQDYNPERPEKINYVSQLGLEETKKLLSHVSHEAERTLNTFGAQAEGLLRMITLNQQRI